MSHALTLITFIPIAGMVADSALPQGQEKFIRWIAALSTLPQLLIAGWLYANFDTTTSAVQFAENAPGCPPITSATSSASTASASRWFC